jgi:hypothetical protein
MSSVGRPFERSRYLRVFVAIALAAALSGLAGVGSLGPVSPVRAEAPAPKAVFIVGPEGSLTARNLSEAEGMAKEAESYGWDVRRVFHPRATWQRMKAHIQGASLVVYMGHGWGYPSPYPYMPGGMNGFGLNRYAGGSVHDVTYIGSRKIRKQVRLARNAVVLIEHACYAPGNGEPGMAIPSAKTARKRVDNYAAGFLAVRAKAVFAFSGSISNLIRDLATTNRTMDEIFMSSGGWSGWGGFIGWRDRYYASVQTPGMSIHLDPHPDRGYQRAVTGKLDLTARQWRNGAAYP